MAIPVIIEPPPPERPTRWWFVHGSIVMAFILFFLFVSILYWYWIRTPEPTSIISIPVGNSALDGTAVVVEGYSLRKPLEVQLSEKNDFGTRIYLVPGDYRLHVKDKDGALLFAREFSIGAYHEWTLNLETLPKPAS